MSAHLLEGVRAVVFDMDGTLIDSHYDWPAIRRELGIEAPSLIDALDALPSPEREAKWQRMREIERRATRGATLMAGARELLVLVHEAGLRTALVTNNSAENTSLLCRRFDLAFDLVLSRDDGFWKPSGIPIAEAVRRLGLVPSECLTVGDSVYDVTAARSAGCACVMILREKPDELGRQADLAFADLETFLRYLRAA